MTDNQLLARSLMIVRRGDGWWIIGLDKDMGAYRTKAEAAEAKRGAQRYLRNCHRRNFIVSGR